MFLKIFTRPPWRQLWETVSKMFNDISLSKWILTVENAYIDKRQLLIVKRGKGDTNIVPNATSQRNDC